MKLCTRRYGISLEKKVTNKPFPVESMLDVVADKDEKAIEDDLEELRRLIEERQQKGK